eukprot:CAMPEP_0172514526 /NCGR_PEP_ID=MMETSP1066-20121228/260730_1 /TAXON_ID=671091 /ORGANISM="Coscinodiscus wailesii, Strain CCMP2513" /LENGTH=443 /DNA_ID=CAMNT_0013295219 /DNA_START=219 /DNA_END=1550 /DNA_ORIENTATION=+
MTSCPICLEYMDPADVAHPLLCQKRCGYEFCMDCIEHLIKSSNSGVEMASDGNLAVKVKLQCPQCRSDLSTTIYDTLLLRKVDKFKHVLEQKDSELTATELQQKASLDTPKMLEKLKVAQSREEHFLMFNTLKNYGKEEGVEVERSGQISPAQSRETVEAPKVVDDSLFNGLEFAMTKEEQVYVTELMTSGEISKLAQASQILYNIADMSKQGVTPSMRGDINASLDILRPKPKPTVHQRQYQYGRSAAVGRALAMGMTAAERKERKIKSKIETYQKTHPLPVRMPNFVTLPNAGDPWARGYLITFLDDEWDGTVADAFARVVIGRNNRLLKKPITHAGVSHVLNAEKPYRHHETMAKPKNRIVIATVKGLAAKQGIQKGDVVTHLNGELFEGDAEALRVAIDRTSRNEDTFSIIVNAEASTAEALRLRGTILQDIAQSETFK